MLEMVLGILSILLAGTFAAEMQTIWHWRENNNWPRKPWFYRLKDNPRFKKIFLWWTSNNWYYEDIVIQWLMKVPLSFLKDGLHLTFSASVVFTIIGSLLLHNLINIYLLVLLIYTVFGLAFNNSYHDTLTKLFKGKK